MLQVHLLNCIGKAAVLANHIRKHICVLARISAKHSSNNGQHIKIMSSVFMWWRNWRWPFNYQHLFGNFLTYILEDSTEQQFCCCMKIWSHILQALMGLVAGRQASRQSDEISIDLGLLNHIVRRLIKTQCCNVINAFQLAFWIK